MSTAAGVAVAVAVWVPALPGDRLAGGGSDARVAAMSLARRPSPRLVAALAQVGVGLLVLAMLAGVAVVISSGSPPVAADLAAETSTAETCPAIDDGGGDEAVVAAFEPPHPRDDRSTVDEHAERVPAVMSEQPPLPPPEA